MQVQSGSEQWRP